METLIIIDSAHPSGEYVINKSDFDPKIHKIKGEEKPKTAKKA